MIKEIKEFFKRFVTIYGYSMLATVFFLEVFSPEAQVGKDFFVNMIIFSFVANIPSLIFIIKKEMTDQELMYCQIICVVLEILLLLPLGHHFGLWAGVAGFIAFLIITVIITFAVRFTLYSADAASARQMLERLKEITGEDEDE